MALYFYVRSHYQIQITFFLVTISSNSMKMPPVEFAALKILSINPVCTLIGVTFSCPFIKQLKYSMIDVAKDL
jgi:hypothetical protein